MTGALERGAFVRLVAATAVFAATGAVAPSPLPIPTPFPSGVPSLVVYHAPPGPGAADVLTPDALITLKGVKVETSQDAAVVRGASAAVDAARATARAAGPFDARWALRFATPTERFVHSVYCDAAARSGLVDGIPVTFANGAVLLDYLTKHFGKV